MKSKDRKRVLARHILCAVVIGPVGTSLADIGPPVAIKLPAGAAVAVAGEEYDGAFEIHVYQPGDLTDFRIEGEGWLVTASTLPTASVRAAVGTTNVTFKAKPTDPDKRVGLSFRYNGRHVRTLFEVGPAYAARRAQPRSLTRIPNTTGLRPTQGPASETPPETPPPAAQGGAVPIQVVGRVVYDRPGINRSDPADGDFDDPGDTPPATVGVDGVYVSLLDDDFDSFEEIWSGHTDVHGFFDSDVVAWGDCDPACDTPDLVLHIRTTNATVIVTNLNEDVYAFSQPEIPDFKGDFYNYGWLTPAASDMPAFHILSNVDRAAWFIGDATAGNGAGAAVIWPDDSAGDTAWFAPGENAIHISTARQWRTDTIIHEYGHAQMNAWYQPIPSPNYCDPEMDCDLPDNCGHCRWCDENPGVAWTEGWANWLVDIVARDFPNRYEFVDGTPFTALYTRSHEFPGRCGDFYYGDPVSTEGFVGALLRDIDDATQDDHGDDPDPDVTVRDGVLDLMCLGAEEIFLLTEVAQPLTVLEFISDFQSMFPGQVDDLWPTAFNVVGSAYVTPFPADAGPPGIVSVCDSSTHPIGSGGSLPCITFEWNPAPDDVTGASHYSYTISTDPAGLEPDIGPDLVRGTDECQLRGSMIASDLGDHYISLKAGDNDGNWSSQWERFGPFEATDCNNNGIMDVCDVTCNGAELDTTGICLTQLPLNLCAREGCGQSPDCNGNLIPDMCDIAAGVSEDCDVNFVPDECQAMTMKHWSGGLNPAESIQWQVPDNWEEGAVPVNLDSVCIRADASEPPVLYREDHTTLTSLACRRTFRIEFGLHPSLELNENSFIWGDLIMSDDAILTVNDRLFVDGMLLWNEGQIKGAGVTEVTGGLELTANLVNLVQNQLKLMGGASFSDDPWITLSGGAEVVIYPSATYTYQGISKIFDGGSGGLVDVRGTLNSSPTLGAASIFTPVNNSGTIRVQAGELTLFTGGTHTGNLLGDPDTKLTLGGTHELLDGSNVAVPTLKLDSSSGSNIRGSVNISDTLELVQGTWTFQPEANIISYGTRLVGTNGTHRLLASTDAPIAFETIRIGPAPEGSVSVYFDTAQPVNVGVLDLNKGSIYGSSPINILNTLTWQSDGFRSGGEVTANGAVFLEAGGGTRHLDRTFNNTQTTTMLGGGLGLGGPGSVRWHNLPAALFNIQANTVSISGRTFDNAGTILRSSGDGTATIGSTIENSGLIHNQTGTLSLSGGGVHDGEVRGDPGTLLRFRVTTEFMPGSNLIAADIQFEAGNNIMVRGNVDIGGTMTVTGAKWTFTDEANIINYGTDLVVSPNPADLGQVVFEAPTDAPIEFDTVTIGPGQGGGSSISFNTDQPANINTLTIIRGTLFGTSPIHVAESFIWQNGNIFPGGALTLDGDTVVHPISSARTISRHVNNAGNFTVLGGFSMGANRQINNLATGVFDLQGDSTRISNGSFHNAGLLLKSAGTGSAEFNGMDIFNTGTVEIQTASIEIQAAEY